MANVRGITRFHVLLVIGTAALTLGACAPPAPATIETPRQLATRPVPAGLGRIYFYREDRPIALRLRPTVLLNNVAVGQAAPGAVFFRDVPPGAYQVELRGEGSERLRFDLQAGETRFVRFDIALGMPRDRVNAKLATETDAAAAVPELAAALRAGGPVAAAAPPAPPAAEQRPAEDPPPAAAQAPTGSEPPAEVQAPAAPQTAAGSGGPASILPGVAATANASFRCPEPGTVVETSVGQLTFSRSEGYRCYYVNGNGEERARYGIFWAADSRWAEQRPQSIQRLWPLAIGKEVEFEEREGDETWVYRYEVVGRETLTVPAGRFDAFVVRYTERPRNTDSPSAEQLLWYAPEVGYLLKAEWRTADAATKATNWQAESVSMRAE